MQSEGIGFGEAGLSQWCGLDSNGGRDTLDTVVEAGLISRQAVQQDALIHPRYTDQQTATRKSHDAYTTSARNIQQPRTAAHPRTVSASVTATQPRMPFGATMSRQSVTFAPQHRRTAESPFCIIGLVSARRGRVLGSTSRALNTICGLHGNGCAVIRERAVY